MKTKNLILIFGPPAVGKMTVGQELAKKKDYVLFHNHHSIEMTLELFEYGCEEFNKINDGIRDLVFETIAKSENIKGFIFSAVMVYDVTAFVERNDGVINQFQKENWNINVLELEADIETRLIRNVTENRLKHKKSKRDLDFSNRNLKSMEEKYVMKSKANFYKNVNYLSIDNTNKSAEEVVEIMIKEFGL